MTENRNNYFFWHRKAFEDAVRRSVCIQCHCCGPECRNPDPLGCAVFRHLPALVRVAQRLKTPDLGSYRNAVAAEISFQCGQSDDPERVLDRLLPVVLKTVLDTDRKLEAESL